MKYYLCIIPCYISLKTTLSMKYNTDLTTRAFSSINKDETLLIHINIEGLCVFRFMEKYNISELHHIVSLIGDLMKQCNETKYLSNPQLYNSYFASVIKTCYDFMVENNRDAQNFILSDPVGFIIIQKIVKNNVQKNIENFNFHMEFATSQHVTGEQIKESLKKNGPDLIEICDLTIHDMKSLLKNKQKD